MIKAIQVPKINVFLAFPVKVNPMVKNIEAKKIEEISPPRSIVFGLAESLAGTMFIWISKVVLKL